MKCPKCEQEMIGLEVLGTGIEDFRPKDSASSAGFRIELKDLRINPSGIIHAEGAEAYHCPHCRVVVEIYNDLT
ncbi:MAG TPA: PF20097 family protein [Bellilinea sp.]|nr:PF20097 family protein [Bellilinea sp.]